MYVEYSFVCDYINMDVGLYKGCIISMPIAVFKGVCVNMHVAVYRGVCFNSHVSPYKFTSSTCQLECTSIHPSKCM